MAIIEITFTDTHIRELPLKIEKMIYIKLLKKILEINEIVKEYNVDFLLHGGDLFDRPDVSVSIVGHFASMLNNIKVPIYTICGNHDIYGHNPQTINRTMLGLLDTLNVVRIIKDEEKVFLNKNGVKFN